MVCYHRYSVFCHEMMCELIRLLRTSMISYSIGHVLFFLLLPSYLHFILFCSRFELKNYIDNKCCIHIFWNSSLRFFVEFHSYFLRKFIRFQGDMRRFRKHASLLLFSHTQKLGKKQIWIERKRNMIERFL